MRDVIVIGGGLSGLLAAYMLRQRGLSATLIEVKAELGGSLRTVRQAGFTIDSVVFATWGDLPEPLLADLGLADALFPLNDQVSAFKDGAGQLVAALAARLATSPLTRMAASSIGALENGRMGVCLENGLLLDARRVIVAVPARYAARLFATSAPEVTAQLLDYHYDTVQRISLGYPAEALDSVQPRFFSDPSYVYRYETRHPSRVPEGHALLQLALRVSPQHATPAQLVEHAIANIGYPSDPLVQVVGYWAEADPLSCYDDAHPLRMQTIAAHLPPGVALIGSDYALNPSRRPGVVALAERVEQARQAVERVLA
jgi:protoporphyrinogen oxidase